MVLFNCRSNKKDSSNNGGALTITGTGTLSTNGGKASHYSCGVEAASVTIDKGCTVNATGDDVTGENNDRQSAGVKTVTGNVTVNGTLNATGGNAGGRTSYGIIAVESYDSNPKPKDVIIGADANLIATGNTQAISGTVKNAVSGDGWSNKEGTGTATYIAPSTAGAELSFLKVEFPGTSTAPSGGGTGGGTVEPTPTTYTIKKGKSVTLKGTEVKEEKKLKLKVHRAVKFESSNPKIAKVNKKGKVTGVKKGSCTVWAYAQNGIFKAIKVTVK